MKHVSRVISLLVCLALALGMLPAGAGAAEPERKLGPNVIRDPDSPTGYTVTFLYDNPSVSSVTFYGDIGLLDALNPADETIYPPSAYRPGMMRGTKGGYGQSTPYTAPMTKNADGIWEISLPLAAGANQYWFVLPGSDRMQPDPANPPKWSPRINASTKNAFNVVYVPYDEKQDFEPMARRATENPRTDGRCGEWDYYEIPFGSRTTYAGIYTPYGYDANRAEPYKTIYMLHGSGQDESDWMGIGSVQKIMDNLVAEGRTEPAVIVSVTSDSPSAADVGNIRNYLLPYVESHYNVSTEVEDRAWAGLSMGSMNTQNLINSAADLFGYWGAFSFFNSVRTSTANLDKTHILWGDGATDFGKLSDNDRNTIDSIQAAGGHGAFERVTGGHDFNTWCQLFRIMCEKYLWRPEAYTGSKSYEDPIPDPTPDPTPTLQLGPNVLRDPDSPTGYTVTFLYDAPTAASVTFHGDIGLKDDKNLSDTTTYDPQDYRPGLMRSAGYSAPMTKNADGIWEISVPLAAGANQYWFTVPGSSRMLPDPANPPQWSPNAAANKDAYNAVYVPYDEKQDYAPLAARAAENPRTDGKTGTWSYVPVTISGRTHYMGVYLPDGYDADRAEPYKTIYILHGGGQDESDWMGIGSVANILDNLIAEGRTEPAVLICPTSNNNMLGSTSDAYANLFDVLIPFVESHYHVSHDKMDRSFAGLSMGSMNTQNIINANVAEKFGYYGAWSGGCSVRANAPGIGSAYILFGGGHSDYGNPSAADVEALEKQGVKCRYVGVTGAHDFNTWCQMFRIYCEDYLWTPAAFGDLGECEHVWENVTTPATCTAEGKIVSTCTRCGETKTETLAKLDHQWDGGKVTTEPTCTADGVRTYTCTVGKETRTEAIAALGHSWDEGVTTKPATETEEGILTYTCTRCKQTRTEKIDKLPADHKHEYTAVVTAPTCTEEGYTIHTCSCGDSYKDTIVDALGHKWDDGVFAEPTCTTLPTATYTCTVCGEQKVNILPGGSYYHPWDEGVITKPATATEEGEKTYTCTLCGATQIIPYNIHEDPMGCPSRDFTDVPGITDWSHAGIDYCVARGLMNGTSATLFSPKGSVTRAQLVTILYRVAGTPEVTEPSKFTDVPADQWYTDPIAWAAANGIVTGMNETTFAPMNKITREQIATILYRYTDGATAEGSIDSFPDATKVSGWAKDALTWAVAENLITGVKAADGTVTLNPTANATRAQIASIIMRYLEAGEAEAQ